jgi:beta-glucanase (GH16 family)
VHDWVGRHSAEAKVQHTALPAGADLSHWNTYGALWTKDTIKFYFNGKMINEAPTPKPCQDNDVFLILSSQTRDSSAGPAQLDIKRVRVFTN